jgi:hypothetical protein
MLYLVILSPMKEPEAPMQENILREDTSYRHNPVPVEHLPPENRNDYGEIPGDWRSLGVTAGAARI